MTAVSESENRAAAAAAVAHIAAPGSGCEKEEESAIVKQQAGTSRQHQSLPSQVKELSANVEEPLVLAIAANKSDLAERAVPVEAAQARQCVPHTRTRTPSARFKHPHNQSTLSTMVQWRAEHCCRRMPPPSAPCSSRRPPRRTSV